MSANKRMLRRIGFAMILVTVAAVGLAYAAEAQPTDMETIAWFGGGLSLVLIAAGFLP